jgi:hypothetical protein
LFHAAPTISLAAGQSKSPVSEVRADGSKLPDVSDAGHEARPAARGGACLPGGRSRSHLK